MRLRFRGWQQVIRPEADCRRRKRDLAEQFQARGPGRRRRPATRRRPQGPDQPAQRLVSATTPAPSLTCGPGLIEKSRPDMTTTRDLLGRSGYRSEADPVPAPFTG